MNDGTEYIRKEIKGNESCPWILRELTERFTHYEKTGDLKQRFLIEDRRLIDLLLEKVAKDEKLFIKQRVFKSIKKLLKDTGIGVEELEELIEEDNLE